MGQSLVDIRNAVVRGDAEQVETLTQKAVQEGIDADQISQKGLIDALESIGQQWKLGEVYLPEVLISAEAVKRGMAVIAEKLPVHKKKNIGTAAIGTVRGDIHDIGKGLVAMMLQTFGFEVHDLGVNVSPDLFVAAANRDGVDIVCMSALLSTVLGEIQNNITEIRDTGSHVSIMIGGAPVTQEFSITVGADGYAPDATSAVDKARQLITEKKR